jgi:hypothetical protein
MRTAVADACRLVPPFYPRDLSELSKMGVARKVKICKDKLKQD